MIDREYIKLNTSILTGSNSDHLTKDEEGNIEASIELRLPDSLFSNDPAHKIDSVSLQTSKMRLSMENTPIAMFDVDTDLSKAGTIFSTSQLDVYPFSYLNNTEVKPDPLDDAAANAFPSYKNHKITFNFYLRTYYPEETVDRLIDTVECKSNTTGYGFPTSSIYYNLLVKAGLIDIQTHPMNLIPKINHGDVTIENDKIMIRNIGALTQLLQDAIENAITYACTSENLVISAYLLNIDPEVIENIPDDLTPEPDFNNSIELPDLETVACYWKYNKDEENSRQNCSLQAAVKPIVKINEQSLSISYDTIPFTDVIPIFWNTAYVNTFEEPEAITIDNLRNSVWHKPPPKRMYIYGTTVNEDPETYSFTIDKDTTCALMNLIANKSLRDTLSFLPWIKVDLDDITQFSDNPEVKPLLIPNLDANDNSFYILDGTTSEVSLSSCDPVQVGYTFSVEEGREFTHKTAAVSGTYTNPPTSISGASPSYEENIIFNTGSEPGYLICNIRTNNDHVSFPDIVPVEDRLSVTWDINEDKHLQHGSMQALEPEIRYNGIIPPLSDYYVATPPNPPPEVISTTTVTDQNITAGITYGATHEGEAVRLDTVITGSGSESTSVTWTFTDQDSDDHSYFRYVDSLQSYTFHYPQDPSQLGDTFTLYMPMDNSGNFLCEPNSGGRSQDSSNVYTYRYYFRLGGSYSQSGSGANTVFSYTSCYIYRESHEYGIRTNYERNDSIDYTRRTNISPYKGNIRLTFTWDNLPIVVLSPIASIVLTLDGVQVTQEYQPVNMTDRTGSSLTSTIPVIENFYSLASSLRDLHDELVVSREQFDDTATYSMQPTAGNQRNMKISAKYIAKDGSLHQIYIPPNGVFLIQLTFGLGIYSV